MLHGQPSIALWKEKHLVVAYQKGIAGKGDMGSIRVPLIVRWSGVTSAGTECREPVLLMDLFHTLAPTGAAAPSTGPADGVVSEP